MNVRRLILMEPKRFPQRAFTLVEILVVMAVLAIISGMLAVGLSGAQRQAMETSAEGLIERLNLTILNVYENETQRIVSLPTTLNGDIMINAQSRLM
jgi:prepilin-type N-terminal cleavage/methylation domain-containing protein